jgi:hypothetical protein
MKWEIAEICVATLRRLYYGPSFMATNRNRLARHTAWKGEIKLSHGFSSAEVQKMWIYTSIPPYTFTEYCLIS